MRCGQLGVQAFVSEKSAEAERDARSLDLAMELKWSEPSGLARRLGRVAALGCSVPDPTADDVAQTAARMSEMLQDPRQGRVALLLPPESKHAESANCLLRLMQALAEVLTACACCKCAEE